MKALVVSQYFFPERFKVNDLCLSLRDRGIEVTVLTAQPNYPEGKIFPNYSNWTHWNDDFDGIRVLRTPIFPRGRSGKFNLMANYGSFLTAATLLGLPRLNQRFDVVLVFATSPITSAIPAILWRQWTRTPLMIWVQDLWPESVSAVGAVSNPRWIGYVGQLVKWIYRRTDVLLMQSNAFKPSMRQWGASEEQMVYLPNWAEDFYLEKATSLETLPGKFNVVFAGNLGKAQSLSTLVEAAELTQEQSQIHWILVGDGSERENLMAKVRAKGLSNISWLGSRLPQEMPAVLQSADALLVTLKKDPIFSLVIPSKVQTCMASGVPLVAAVDGEAQRVIQSSGAGLAGPAEDARALADHVLKLYQMPTARREEMGRRGRDYCLEHFSKEQVLNRLIDQMENLADKKVQPNIQEQVA